MRCVAEQSGSPAGRADSGGNLPLYTGLAVIALGAFADAELLLRYSRPVGLDGYYYLIQLKQLIATGHPYYPTSTRAIFYVFRFISIITHTDATHTIKITACALNVLLNTAIYIFSRDLTERSSHAIWAPLACTVFGSHVAFVGEYVKELAAVTCLAWAAVALSLWLSTRSWRHAGACFLLITTSLTFHRSAAAIVFAVLGSVLAAVLCSRFRLLIVLIVAIAWVLPLVAAYFGQPPLFAPDVSLRSYMWWPPERLLLILLAAGFLFWHTGEETNPGGHTEIICLAICIFAVCLTANPILTGDFSSVIGRVQLTAYLQVAVLVPLVLYLLLKSRSFMSTTLFNCIVGIFLLLGALLPSPMQGLSVSYMDRRERLVTGLEALRDQVRTESHLNALVIAAHGDEFVVTAVLGVPAQQHWHTTSRSIYWLLRLAPSIQIPATGYAVSQEVGQDFIVLLRDQDCRTFWLSLSNAERDIVGRDNPELLNAGFLIEPDSVTAR